MNDIDLTCLVSCFVSIFAKFYVCWWNSLHELHRFHHCKQRMHDRHMIGWELSCICIVVHCNVMNDLEVSCAWILRSWPGRQPSKQRALDDLWSTTWRENQYKCGEKYVKLTKRLRDSMQVRFSSASSPPPPLSLSLSLSLYIYIYNETNQITILCLTYGVCYTCLLSSRCQCTSSTNSVLPVPYGAIRMFLPLECQLNCLLSGCASKYITPLG